ncbi:MAG: DUF89 family protein [Candidatus Helarchaeota archaeon]|nr:DUF89 family protein [Candidatus Helarchaeota archaeon]
MVQKIWIGPECLTCLATIAYEILQRSTDDPQMQIKGMRKTYEILSNYTITSLPTNIANKIYWMIQSLTQNVDPFKNIKIQSNKLAKKAINRIHGHVVEATSPESRFRRALAAAITGNLIDFGTAGHSIELKPEVLEQNYLQIYKEGFAIDYSAQLFAALKPGKEIVYIADNAGEVYFDQFLLRQMKNQSVKITLVVKGAPISNDATMDDVRDPIFNEVVNKIITTGIGAVGVSMTESSQEFMNYLQTADYIVAKGQSNFETLYYHHKELTKNPIFFIFRTKCLCIAKFLGQTVGKNIVLLKKT